MYTHFQVNKALQKVLAYMTLSLVASILIASLTRSHYFAMVNQKGVGSDVLPEGYNLFHHRY